MLIRGSHVDNQVVLLWSVIGLTVIHTAYAIQQHLRNEKSKRIPDGLLSSPYAKELQLGIDLALKAGANMISYCDTKGTVDESNDQDLGIVSKTCNEDFCTKIDIENEKLIVDGILSHFPSHKIIGEETTGTGSLPQLTHDKTWIIDPIDGTTNFAAGIPFCCVSVGLCFRGKPVVGIVYAPMTDELYLGAKGCGSYRNGVRLSSRKHKPLSESIVCTEFGYARDPIAINKMSGALQRILEHGCRSVKQYGSGVLDMCYVATGRFDVVYAGLANEGWKPWDVSTCTILF